MGFLPKDYVWVHTRIDKCHADNELMSIDTNFEIHGDIVSFKAVVTTKKGIFSWSSFWATNKEKAFEKLETVAVGRALAFAWYETQDWIASREELENFEDKQAPKYFNYEDLVDAVEAGNTKEADLTKLIKQDWFTLSVNAKKAVRHYVETGKIDKNLFFNN